MAQHIKQTVEIAAPAAAVWEVLTTPGLMGQWMGEPEMALDICTDWTVGSPIVIRGFHHLHFENRGTVLCCEPCEMLVYNYLSSFSDLPDTPGNRTVVDFRLTAWQDQTSVALVLSNFPTEAIQKHVEFYWRTTLGLLKKFVEQREHCAGRKA